MGHWLKCFATIAVMVTLVYARPYAADRDMMRGGEIFSLCSVCIARYERHDFRSKLPDFVFGS
jgi:hypothetical protein